MSKKMKKLICALLAGAMVLSSASFAVFADDEPAATAAPEATTEATAEATTAPEATAEATEAPAEATEAPAAAPVVVEASKYDNDNYYAKALSLCKALGIITGYEDGSIKPDSTVTRAEMAAIILRTINSTTTSKYQNIFSDVEASHWAADTIQSANALAIINGFPGGTFQPDGNVTYEQAAKMLVCALNAKTNADANGGYPNGYLKVAADRDVLKNAQGTIGTAAERGLIIKMVYNTLLADYNEFDGTSYGTSDKTLAEYAFKVKEAKGILMSTASTSITSTKSNNGQILIAKTKEEGKRVDNEEEVYETDLTNIDDLLASNITYYYAEDGLDSKKVLAVVEDASKTDTLVLNNDQIADIEEFNIIPESGAPSIKLYGTKTYKVAENALIVYNGAIISEDDYAQAQAAHNKSPRFYTVSKDDDGKDVYDPISYADFIKPAVGQIKLVENNSDQTGYDIVFIDSYETMLVTSATTKKVIGKINGASDTIDVDEDVYDLSLSTTIRGMEAAPRNLKKNDVVSLKRDLAGESMEFVVTGESITGTAKSTSKNNGKTYVTVNGDKYEVDANAIEDIKIGSQGIFYLDNFNRIGYAESASADGMLQSGEKYGWILNAYESESGEDKIIKLFTMEGNAVEATLASSVDFWGATDTSNSSKTKNEVFNAITKDGAINDAAFKALDNAYKKDKNGKVTDIPETPLRLVKYKMNSTTNKLSRLYLAVDYTKVEDTSALRIKIANAKAGAINGSIGGFTVADGIVEFTAPKESADMKDEANYAIGQATSSNYVVKEDGSTRTFIIGEFDGVAANIIVNFTASATSAARFGDVDSAGNGPSVMVVDTIGEGYDEKDDINVYVISGYAGGSPVTVTTSKNTNFGDAKAALWGGTGNRYFQVTQLWNGANEDSDYAKMTISSLTDSKQGLKEGDILLYTVEDGKARALIRYASAANAKFNDDGTFKESSIPTINANNYSNSSSRVHYYFEKVTDSGLDDTAWITFEKYGNFTFDASTSIDLITISKTGKVTIKDAVTVSEIEQGDYVFANVVDKGQRLGSMIIYRVED